MPKAVSQRGSEKLEARADGLFENGVRLLPRAVTAAALAVGAFTFQAPVALTLSRQGIAVVSIASADFNRDGTAGVVSGNLGTPPSAFCRVCVGDFRAG